MWVLGMGRSSRYPLKGEYIQGFLRYRLERQSDRWTFYNHLHGAAEQFDFTLRPTQLTDFADSCHHLQTSPESGFVKVTVCQIFTLKAF